MNAAHTPTPRTDAQEFIPVSECGHFPTYPTVSSGFARQLEREFAEARREIASLRPRAEKSNDYRLAAINAEAEIEKLDRKLTEAREQSDRLAAALRELMFDCLRFRIEPSDDAYKNAESSLAALEGRESNPAQESPPTTP
jgi:predicted  nucleic acid-binding Zn-ribbon protein